MKWLMAIALAASLAAPASVPAQQKKLYKCGTQFQDRPCEGPKEPAKAAAAPTARAAPAAQPVQSSEESRRQIRCENWERQIEDVRVRERAEKSAAVIKGLEAQRGVMDQRMKADGC
jgi:hypothetical protein